jgi:endonuclease/exonuclease/phosphatase family metal-dependent hydrolase
MAKLFSFASWNVEHFSNDSSRVSNVVDTLNDCNPDVFALFEVRGKAVFNTMTQKMPNYHFSILENRTQVNMEILVGVKRTFQSFVTFREEFKSKVPSLRPGALVTLTLNNEQYPILFLHLKSLSYPRDWGLRDDMFRHVAKLKRTLDKVAEAQNTKSNLMVVGDLNTMGLNAPYNNISDLSQDQEIASVDKRLSRVGFSRKVKTHEASWWGGTDTYEPSKLDHVYAPDHLTFKDFNGSDIDVIGWPQKQTKRDKIRWINKYSDHALICGELRTN